MILMTLNSGVMGRHTAHRLGLVAIRPGVELRMNLKKRREFCEQNGKTFKMPANRRQQQQQPVQVVLQQQPVR